MGSGAAAAPPLRQTCLRPKAFIHPLVRIRERNGAHQWASQGAWTAKGCLLTSIILSRFASGIARGRQCRAQAFFPPRLCWYACASTSSGIACLTTPLWCQCACAVLDWSVRAVRAAPRTYAAWLHQSARFSTLYTSTRTRHSI